MALNPCAASAARKVHQKFREKESQRLQEGKAKSLLAVEEGRKFTEACSRLEQDLTQLTTRSTEVHSRMEGAKEAIAALRQKKETLEQTLNLKREDLSFKRSRLKSLLDLERNFEGYAEGVRSLLKARKEGSNGILGVVADFVDSPPQYEIAVSAALGEKLQYVIVNSHEEGMEALAYLKTQSSGRSTMIPMDIRESEPKPFPHRDSGVIGPLLDLVGLKTEHARIAAYLLGDVILVRSLNDAVSLWRSNGHQKTLVTLDGEVMDPYGVVSGGSAGLPGKVMLEKKREIKELRVQVAVLEGEIGLLEDSVSHF